MYTGTQAGMHICMYAFSALTEGHPAHKTSASKPCAMMVNGWGVTQTTLWVQSFGLSCEDVQDKDDWRLENQGSNRLTQVYLENGR